ncbi:MAG: glycoside hydrolase family 127 protein, partial [Rectinemataceae bacterium]|nr:glycoside hydrolase family 127 protein [Rectinemataceae bacterium]
MAQNMDGERKDITIRNIAIRGGFWKRYRDLVRDTVIPYQWEALNDRVPDAPKSCAVKNLKIAAGLAGGSFGGMRFADSDLAKWLEAVSWALAEKRDPALESTADEVIEAIGSAQRSDGYFNTYYIIKFF